MRDSQSIKPEIPAPTTTFFEWSVITGEPLGVGLVPYAEIAHALDEMKKDKLLAEAKNSRAKS